MKLEVNSYRVGDVSPINKDSIPFNVGKVIVTLKASKLFDSDELWACLSRHLDGDWGDVSEEVRHDNNQALLRNEPLVSLYNLDDGRVLQIITEDNRETTTLMLPDDY